MLYDHEDFRCKENVKLGKYIYFLLESKDSTQNNENKESKNNLRIKNLKITDCFILVRSFNLIQAMCA